MRPAQKLLRGALALAIAAGAAAPSNATTLIRQSLEDLVAENRTIVLGEVLDTNSYWNPEGTFILTDEEDLPGALGVRTVRGHSQSVFDIVIAKDGLRAISQANRHPLVPDARGSVTAPGGKEGLPLNSMMQTIRGLVERSRREVK